MSELVESTLSLSEDGKTLIVSPAKLEGSYVYSIHISGLKDKFGNLVDDINLQYQTPYIPMHASLREMRQVQKRFGLTDDEMRQYIHEGSVEADFIQSSSGVSDSDEVAYAKKQYAKTKALYDVTLESYMTRTSSGAGAEYTLDVATYKESLNSSAYNKILDKLKNDLATWQDAIRGYTNPGRAKPKATRVGVNSSQNNEVTWTSFDTVVNDISRDIPQWA